MTTRRYRVLMCEKCGEWTTHELNGSEYVCDCGTRIKYMVNNAPEACAMDLRESKDAQDRFSEWAQELLSHE